MKSKRIILVLCAALLYLNCTTSSQIDQQENLTEESNPEVSLPEENLLEESIEETPSLSEQTNVLTETLDDYSKTQDIEQALTVISEIAEESEDPEIQQLYADSLIANQNFSEAEIVLLELLEENPGDNDILYQLALIAFSQMEIEKADNLASTMIENDPEDSRGFTLKGNLDLFNRNYNNASENFSLALELDENNPDAILGISTALLRLEKYKESLVFLDKAALMFPGDPYIFSDRCLARLGDDDIFGAEEDINRAIELDSENPWHYLDRGRLYLIQMNNPSKARPDLEKTLSLDPDNFLANVYLAGICSESDQIDSAINYYLKVLELNSSYNFAYKTLGVLYFMNQDWENSVIYLDKAITDTPDDLNLYFLDIAAVKLSGDLEKGKTLADDYMYLMPRDTIYYYMMRFYLEPDSDFLIQSQMKTITDEDVKVQMLFYLALQYKINDQPTLAFTYFGEVADSEKQGIDEIRIAQWFTNQNIR